MDGGLIRFLTGDCREVLPTLEAESVQCCVTSPPYWGLRDYGTAEWEGGDTGCEHINPNGSRPNSALAELADKYAPRKNPRNPVDQDTKRLVLYREACGKCGARRIDSQLGLEATPEEYIEGMVAVFREVWRVLRDDGTLWLNMGDSYATNGYSAHPMSKGVAKGDCKSWGSDERGQGAMRTVGNGLKPKDLCMMPARLAMALQADGWYLRSEIVWHKPNPMPESVTDRCTKSHEMIYMLAKKERYHFDAEAIKEPSIYVGPQQSQKRGEFNGKTESMIGLNAFRAVTESRNKRTVWTTVTQPYAEAHFATFPEDLIKPCILAGSKPGDTILDHFAGSGTVGKVALELGRRAVLIELNPAYVTLAKERTDVTPGFAF